MQYWMIINIVHIVGRKSMNNMTHLSLFTGIGGLDLAAEWAGFQTVGQCEWADYPTKILEKHWPDMPRWRDIRTLTKEDFYERVGLQTVDIISGGFPCQPFSVAGKRKGENDDRFLWPEMLRVIKEIRPTWVVGENVAGFINMGLDTALSDLEAEEYTAKAFVLPACSVGAFHRRDRIFIVANINVERMEGSCEKQILGKSHIQNGQISKPFSDAEKRFDTYQSRLCRSLYGIPNGVDRIKCLGNAVVPQQAYPIFKAIADIERG